MTELFQLQQIPLLANDLVVSNPVSVHLTDACAYNTDRCITSGFPIFYSHPYTVLRGNVCENHVDGFLPPLCWQNVKYFWVQSKSQIK